MNHVHYQCHVKVKKYKVQYVGAIALWESGGGRQILYFDSNNLNKRTKAEITFFTDCACSNMFAHMKHSAAKELRRPRQAELPVFAFGDCNRFQRIILIPVFTGIELTLHTNKAVLKERGSCTLVSGGQMQIEFSEVDEWCLQHILRRPLEAFIQ